MRDPLAGVSIRYKLAASYVAICLLAFGVGGYLVSISARSTLEREIQERLEWQARAQTEVMGGRLETLGRRTEDFASDGFIRENTALLANGRGGERIEQVLRAHLLNNKLPLEPAFRDLAVYGSDGRLLLRAGASDDDIPDRLRDADADASGLSISGFAGGATGKIAFRIMTPLWDLDRVRRIGRLVSVVDAEAWLRGAMTAPAPSNDVSQGMVNYHLIEDGEGVLLEVFAQEDGSAGVRVRHDRAAVTPVTERTGREEFRFSTRIPMSGWILSTGLDASAAFVPVSALQSRFLAAGIFIALAALILAFFPMRFLVAPLSTLRTASRRLSEGDLKVRVEAETTDEIGDLGRAFNRMADSIEERTRRLEDSAAALERGRAALAAERDRLRTIVSSMDDGLILIDPDGRIEMANAAAEPIVQRLRENSGEIDSHRCARSGRDIDCLACLRDSSHVLGSCTVATGDRIYEVLATNLGAGRGRVLVSRDVTEYVTMDEKKAHQERLAILGEVAAVMAHELNNPLAAISIFGQMMDHGCEPGSKWKENIEVILRNAEICKNTIRGLLDFSSTAASEQEEFGVHDLVEDTVRFLTPLLSKGGCVVERRFETGHDVIIGVEAHVRQVLVNLLMNASQAMAPAGGTITIATESSDAGMIIRVQDEGPGVPAEVRERIFQPFFTTRLAQGGTGLGLSTSRRIMEAAGGSIELETTGPAGTVFAVRLPRRFVSRAVFPGPMAGRGIGISSEGAVNHASA